MERRRKVNLNGQDYQAVEIPFQTGAEHWNEYLLNDGTVIKLRTVTSQVLRVEGEYDNDGNPRYVVKSTNVMAVSAPDKLRKPDGEES